MLILSCHFRSFTALNIIIVKLKYCSLLIFEQITKSKSNNTIYYLLGHRTIILTKLLLISL